MFPIDRIKQASGVYLMRDLDELPVYAGQATNLKKRMREHFISQRSDVLTDMLLDLYEVRTVEIWYAVEAFELPLKTDDDEDLRVTALRHPLDVLEAALLKQFNPRWNRGRKPCAGGLPSLTRDNADVRIELLEGLELDIRQNVGQRIEAKLLHILRAVRKVRVSGGSKSVRAGIHRHIEDLDKLCRKGIREAGPEQGAKDKLLLVER